MSKRKTDAALLDDRSDTAKKQKATEKINYFECLPDSTLAYIFSLLPPVEYPYESWAKYLRGISRQFCRVWDEIEPCFAFMKMIQREYQLVQESGGTIHSPWFTEYETSFLTSLGANFDLRDPLPAPELIPLTAVQIIAATLYSQSKLAYHHPKNTRLVYAARCTATFISPVINELSKFNGKEVIFQETVSYQCPYADTSSQVLEVNQTLFIPDPEFAAYAGVPPYAPIDRKNRSRETVLALFPPSEERSYDYASCLPHKFINCGAIRTNEKHIYPLNLHYMPNKSLLDQLPKLPRAVYQLLASQTEHNIQEYGDLCRVIQVIKWNLVIKPTRRIYVEQLYEGFVERHNINQIFDQITIYGPPINSEMLEIQIAFKKENHRFELGFDNCIYSKGNSVVPHTSLCILELQKRLNLEVLLPEPDFHLQIARILQNDFFSEEKQPKQTPRIKPPALPKGVAVSNQRDPKDLTVYCELDEKAGEIRRYEVLLTSKNKEFCGSDNIVMQVLQSSNDEYYFNIAITYVEKKPDFCWKKKYGLDLAKEIFERWFGFYNDCISFYNITIPAI